MTWNVAQDTGNVVSPVLDGAAEREQLDGLKPAGDAIGLFHAWWRGDPLPALPHLPGLAIEPTDDDQLIAGVMGTDAGAIHDRMRRGHRPWLARIKGEPVGAGWVATREAAIDELGIGFAIPPSDRYLWDFVTSPAWRGRGIYPRLLQAIVTHEAEAERFWVGHDLANVASARGIAKAGLPPVGTVYRLRTGDLVMVPSGPLHRAEAAARLFGIPLADRPVPQTA